ncbi:MAG TPA: acyl-CoA dehydrogenase family protein [Candidatus Kryptonia bacterium]|nr:acyl-CoA dehydrogenase family protein [Candidatus Kryptonia bacterium]
MSEEQEQLQRSAREFLARECPPPFVREVMRDADGFPRGFYEKIAGLGWTGLTVPATFGGSGLALLDLSILMEEVGRAVMPGPFMATMLATLAIMQAGSPAHKRLWLPKFATGGAIGTVAFLEESDRLDAAGVTTRAKSARGGYRLDGTKLFVADALVADVIVAAFRTSGKNESGVTLFLVPRDAPGLSVTPLPTIDQTRRVYEVAFDHVEVPANAVVGKVGEGWKRLERVRDAAAVLLAADSLGGAQKALEMAVEYSKVREQFGRPIGSFQAVKHMAAEIVSEIEPARALVWYAAYAYDATPREAARAASMAKARLSDVYMRTADRAVQMHGGIGFTWEHDMHLWFKRAKWNELAFGDATFHRERVATLGEW